MARYFLAVALGVLMIGQASAQEWATAVSKHKTEDRAVVFRYVKSFAPKFDRSTQPDRIILVWNYNQTVECPLLKSAR